MTSHPFVGQTATENRGGSGNQPTQEPAATMGKSAAKRDSLASPSLPREAGPGLTVAIAELERIERELSTPYARALQGEVKAVLGNWLTGLRSAIEAVRASAPASRETTDEISRATLQPQQSNSDADPRDGDRER